MLRSAMRKVRESPKNKGDSMRILTKLVLLALASSAGAALAADDDVVIMYGMGMPFLDHVKEGNATTVAPANRPSTLPASAYSGANNPARDRITVGTSHWGFRGSESLGGGWKAVFQMESAFPIDQNTGVGWAARDSKVGLFNPRY